ncbi:YbaN family protein [Halomonas sediminis]|uniref:Inner membrane protein n=1 Tax=Vreelandella zhuhanensis TaxID=2684210 RepID=A0A7X3KQX3_9GAMM|nr:YbaN family protein [Halomonas zhuhanensis]MWJ28950.1 DUF454 family protein [Halomonas zhuhanensis]
MLLPRSLCSRLYQCLALLCISLGAMGIVLPLLPTTPFLLVAAWAAPKGSPRLANWLWTHPRLGPILLAWRDQRAVPRRAKNTACALLIVSWVTLMMVGSPLPVLALTGILFTAVAAFVLTRPTVQLP